MANQLSVVPNSLKDKVKKSQWSSQREAVQIACDQLSMKPDDEIWLLEHEYTNVAGFWTLDK